MSPLNAGKALLGQGINGWPKYVYHYTKMSTLINLLDTTNLDLKMKSEESEILLNFHATEIESFSDRSEYKAVRDLLVKIENSNVDYLLQDAINGPAFVISFSKNEDDALMWLQYADGGHGVCLKFDVQKICDKLIPSEQKPYEYIRFDKCLYAETRDLKEKYLKLSNFYDTHYMGKNIWDRQVAFVDYQLSTSFLKNKGFKNEKEYRLVTTSKDYHFLCKEHDFGIYTEIKIPFECLEKIKIGPRADFAMSKHLIEKWLQPITDCAGSHQVQVNKSSLTIK